MKDNRTDSEFIWDKVHWICTVYGNGNPNLATMSVSSDETLIKLIPQMKNNDNKEVRKSFYTQMFKYMTWCVYDTDENNRLKNKYIKRFMKDFC